MLKNIDLYSISFKLVLTTILSLGTSQINKSMILDFSDIMDTSSRVLDNNLDTFYHSKDRSNASWFVRLDSVYDVKWILISIRGGNNCMTVNINEECILSTGIYLKMYPSQKLSLISLLSLKKLLKI